MPRAAGKGQECGREEEPWWGEVELNGPPTTTPFPPTFTMSSPSSPCISGKRDPSCFKETSRFVPFPRGACQFVTDCRNP